MKLLTNFQNFTQKDLNKVKYSKKFFFWGGATFLKHPVYYKLKQQACSSVAKKLLDLTGSRISVSSAWYDLEL